MDKTKVHGTAALVVARLTAIRKVGTKLIIEVRSDASFGCFYQYFTQDSNRRSTKTLIRTASRNEGLHPWYRAYRMQPGLEVIAARLLDQTQFVSVKVRIIKKRVYRQLLETVPDVLGLTKVAHTTDRRISTLPTPRMPVYIPAGWLTIEKRMDIILGRSR